MNTKLITLGIALFLGFSLTAQKKEVKNAEKAIKKENYSEAIKELESAKSEGIMDENDKWVVRYYVAKGNAYLGPNLGENQEFENLKKSGKAFEKALALDADNKDALEGMTNTRNSLVNSAIEDQKTDNYTTAKEKLYTSYQLNKNDTIHLYYAAGSAINAQEYRDAIEYFEKLLEIGYDGSRVEYSAINNETQEKEVFADESYRDLVVKSGEYSSPEDTRTPSVRAEIAKNISTMYIQLEEPENAMKSIAVARELAPNDVTLVQAEADLYYQLGDLKKYKERMNMVKEMAPEDAMVYYNLGVASEQMEDEEAAIEFYEKSIELDPGFINAYLNISSLILSREKALVDEMNELGMSAADNKRYDELNEQKKELYKEALPFLEEAYKVDAENRGVVQTLMNIHYQLGNDDEAEKFKKALNKM